MISPEAATKRSGKMSSGCSTSLHRRPAGINRPHLLRFHHRLQPKPLGEILPTNTHTCHSHTTSGIIFFHGGGFRYLSADSKSYDTLCRDWASKLPAAVVSVNYRLTPEHKFPCQYLDRLDTLRFLSSSENTEDVNLRMFLQSFDSSKAFLIGDSCGANIAHHVARDWASSDFDHPSSDIRIRGVVSIQPFFGGEERLESEIRLKATPMVNLDITDWLWKLFSPEGETRDHEAVHVFGKKGKNVELGSEFPRVLVVIGGFDPMQDWQRRYAAGLREREKDVNVIYYKNVIHGLYLLGEFPEGKLLVDAVREFIYI